MVFFKIFFGLTYFPPKLPECAKSDAYPSGLLLGARSRLRAPSLGLRLGLELAKLQLGGLRRTCRNSHNHDHNHIIINIINIIIIVNFINTIIIVIINTIIKILSAKCCFWEEDYFMGNSRVFIHSTNAGRNTHRKIWKFICMYRHTVGNGFACGFLKRDQISAILSRHWD